MLAITRTDCRQPLVCVRLARPGWRENAGGVFLLAYGLADLGNEDRFGLLTAAWLAIRRGYSPDTSHFNLSTGPMVAG